MSSVTKAALGSNMAQRAGEKSWEAGISGRRWWNLFLKPGFDINVFWNVSMSNRDFSLLHRFRSIFADRSGGRAFNRADGHVMPSHHLIRNMSICSRSNGMVLEQCAPSAAAQDWLTIDSQSAEGGRLDRP